MISAKVITIGIILLVLLTVVGLLAMVIIGMKKQKEDNYNTQRKLTDRELFYLIDEQPDGIMTSERLAQSSALTHKEAKSRLAYLYRNGVFEVHQGGFLKQHYSLREEVDKRPAPEISNEPFLTVEDILTLFKFHEYKLSFQKICISTGLPVSVIKEELDYFIKQKIISQIYSVVIPGVQPNRIFLLEEPYRSNTDKFLEKEQEINLELQKIYMKETKEN